ncbi:MAG: ABC transporter permease [Acidimicrobiia bacterium]
MAVDIAARAPDIAREVPSTTRDRRYDLWITPITLILLATMVIIVWTYSDFDKTTADILEPDKLLRQARQHIGTTLWSTVVVVGVAIPAGILITRPRFKRLATPILTIANSGQAIPAYGLIVLFFAWLGQGIGLWIGGTTTAVVALAVFGLLPVLRNTMVGLEQVDQSVIEAGRGMGMSRLQALVKIELPLAVSVIFAGVRTALVINVGMGALVFLIGAGGLGETINSGLKLQRNTAIFVGAALVAILALLVDWLAALAERYLRPKGL